MIDLKEAYEKAKANSEEDVLVEAYENEDFYIFVFAETENPEIEDNDGGGIAIDKKNGELKTLFGQKLGIEINVKPSKEISLEEIKALKKLGVIMKLPTKSGNSNHDKFNDIEIEEDKEEGLRIMNLYGKNLLTLLDYNKEEIEYLLNLAAKLKYEKKNGIPHTVLKGKNIVLLFEKDSTRTRCAFEVAGMDLGMGVTYIGSSGSQMGKKESIKDTARVLGRMFDGIEYRGFKQETVECLAKYSGVPVWNGLTEKFHPTQILADFLTMKEYKGNLEGLKFAYLGDGRYNMGNSYLVASAIMGLDYRMVGPKKLWPSKELVEKAKKLAEVSGAKITLTEDINEGVKDCDAIATDVWVSMGEDFSVWEERINLLKKYQVNKDVMAKAKKDAIFLHCLPSFHNLETTVGMEVYEKFGLNGLEVTEDVFEGPQSVVFDEAENRLHTIKAVIYASMVNEAK